MAAKGRKTRDMSRFSVGDVPVFADIDDLDAVYRLTMDLREKRVGDIDCKTKPHLQLRNAVTAEVVREHPDPKRF